MKKIAVVSGYYGKGNIGDEAILAGLKAILKDKIDLRPFTFDKKYTSNLHRVISYNRWDIKDIKLAFEEADLFISGGGGLFQDWSFYTPFYYGIFPLLSKIYKIPAISIGQSIGPLRKLLPLYWTSFVFSLFDYIAVRDIESYKWLLKRGIRAKLMGDLAFQLGIEYNLWNEGRVLQKKVSSLGVILRDWKDKDTVNIVVAVLEDFWGKESLEYLVFQKNDQEKVLPKATYYDNFLDVIEWIRKKDFVVTMRLHGVIFCLLTKVPFLAVSYDNKIKNFLQTYHIEEAAIDIEDIRKGRLREKLLFMIKNKNKIFSSTLYRRIREIAYQDRREILKIIEKYL